MGKLGTWEAWKLGSSEAGKFEDWREREAGKLRRSGETGKLVGWGTLKLKGLSGSVVRWALPTTSACLKVNGEHCPPYTNKVDIISLNNHLQLAGRITS